MPNTLLIHQKDPLISNVLGRLNALGTGVVDVNGNLTQVHEIENMHFQHLKGDPVLDHPKIYSAIESFAGTILSQVQNDLVEMQIIFMFHQTSKTNVLAILAAMNEVERTEVLRHLAELNHKALKVSPVVFLSCESATDKVLQQPIDKKFHRFVAQARLMRDRASESFKTLEGPPYPTAGPSAARIYFPAVVTFSTGDVDRGGVVMDPFKAKFVDLDGHYEPDGEWVYDDPDPNNQHPNGTPTKGAIHVDQAGMPSTTETLNAGESHNFMGFDVP